MRNIYKRKLAQHQQKGSTLDSISILYANIGAWKTKGDSFTDIARKNKCRIGVTTEVNQQSPSNSYFQKSFFSGTYKGAAVLFNENFIKTPKLVDIISKPDFDVLSVIFPTLNNLAIISGYVSAGIDDCYKLEFLRALINIFQITKEKTEKIILLGDWNITVFLAASDLGWSSSSSPLSVHAAIDFIASESLHSIHRNYTWKRGDRVTAPDFLLCTQSLKDVIEVEILPSIEARQEHLAFVVKCRF